MPGATTSLMRAAIVMAAVALPLPGTALAQVEGGLYIAGYRHSFEHAAVLALPPNTVALTKAATQSAAAVRERVVAAGGVLFVCQRDVDGGKIDAAALVPGVIAVRGFPPRGSDAIPRGERYYPDEDRTRLPQDNRALKRLRKACS